MKNLINIVLLCCGFLLGTACTESEEQFDNIIEKDCASTRTYQNVVTIHVETPGTLKELLGDRLATTDKLILSGPVDAKDVDAFLNEMPLLVALDLTEVSFVESDIPINVYNPIAYEYDEVLLESNKIANYMFAGNTRLIDIILPKNVTDLGEYCFWNCMNLESIVLPDGLQSIGEAAFIYNSHLKTIVIPNGVKKLERNSFRGCKSLESISLSDNLNIIGEMAFYECTSLIDIALPFSINVIKKAAFWGCGLTEIVLPTNLAVIEESLFTQCASLAKVTLPTDLSIIRRGAFEGCISLSDISLPNSLITIEEYAFNGSALINVLWPANLEVVSQGTFASCKSLTNFVVPTDCKLKTIEGSAFYGSGLVNINFPEGLEYIGMHAFVDTQLKGTIIFPSTLKFIDNCAFNRTKVTSIYLPNDGEIFLDNIFGQACNSLIYTQSSNVGGRSVQNVIEQYKGNYCASLVLDQYSPFHCPEKFTAAKVTFRKSFNVNDKNSCKAIVGKASNWYGLSLPFRVDEIVSLDGRTFAPFRANAAGEKPFWLRKLSSDATFENVTSIEAGEPYIIAFPNSDKYKPEYNVSGEIMFAANAPVEIPVTEEHAVNSAFYSIRRNYEILPMSESIYLLNSARPSYLAGGWEEGVSGDYNWGSVFLPSLRNSWPFEAYITASSSPAAIYVTPPVATRGTRELGPVPDIDDM